MYKPKVENGNSSWRSDDALMPYSFEFERGAANLNLNVSGGEEKTNRQSITPLVPILLLLLLGSAPAHGQKIVNMSLRAHLDLGDLGATPVCPISGLSLRVNDVWGYDSPTGQAMALVGLCNGTAIVDVTDAATATVLTTILGPRSVWRDIKTFDHYAYVVHDVVHPTDPTGTGVGVQIIDLADPAFPVVSTLTDGFIRAHSLYIDEDLEHLYVVGWDPDAAALVESGFHPKHETAGFTHGFRIYDLSVDPENPTFLGMWDERYVHDLYVRNNTVYAAALSNGLWFVDISDPSVPSTIDHVTYTQGPPGPALANLTHNVWVTDDGSTAVVTDEQPGQRLKFLDVSDLSAAVKISEYEAKPGILPHNAVIVGDKTYVSYYSEGAVILDISDPAAPLEIGYYDTFLGAEAQNGAWGIYPFNESGLIYVSDIVSGLYVFEFHDPRFGLMLTLVPDKKLKRRKEATLTAKVTLGGVPQAGRTVTFTPADTTLASVSHNSGVTDGNGEAETIVQGEYRGRKKTTTIEVTVDGVSRDQIVRVPDISPVVLVLLAACIVLFCLFRKEEVGASKI